jgi:hypothetical protein
VATIEALIVQPLPLIPEGRAVFHLEVAHTSRAVQTLFRELNLTALGMILHFRQKVAQPQPVTKRSAEYMVNNFIGKFL